MDAIDAGVKVQSLYWNEPQILMLAQPEQNGTTWGKTAHPMSFLTALYMIDINLVVSLCTDCTPGGELVYWKWNHSGGERGNLLGTWRGKVEGHVGGPSNCLHSTKGICAQKHLYQMVAERSSKHSWTFLTVLGASWRKKWFYWKKWLLWVILSEGDPPDTSMAMRLNPPDLGKCRTYERYRQELKAWQKVTDIPKTKKGIDIALSLPQDSGESGLRENYLMKLNWRTWRKKMGWEFWLIFLTKLLVKMISVIAWKNLKTTVVDQMRQFWIIYQDLTRNITDSRS